MAKYLNFQNILTIFFSLIIIFLLFKNNKENKPIITKVDGKKYELLKHNVDTIVIKNTQTIIKEGKDIYHETIVYDTTYLSLPIDTSKILSQYFTTVIYKDTLKLKDSLGYITLIDTITQNKIDGRKWIANVNKLTINNTTYLKELPRNQVYIGFNGEVNKTNLVNGVGLGFIFKNKKDNIYLINAGVNTRLTPYINGGMYWKIKLRK